MPSNMKSNHKQIASWTTEYPVMSAIAFVQNLGGRDLA